MENRHTWFIRSQGVVHEKYISMSHMSLLSLLSVLSLLSHRFPLIFRVVYMDTRDTFDCCDIARRW
jgi:hypothetical protein